MAINVTSMSINVDGVDTWFEYGDMLQELADKVDAFRRNFRGSLTQTQRDNLRVHAENIREKAREITTITAIHLLTQLDQELTQLKIATNNIDGMLDNIQNTRKIISGLADILGLITNILTFV